jgi:hypothetical protein
MKNPFGISLRIRRKGGNGLERAVGDPVQPDIGQNQDENPYSDCHLKRKLVR